MPDIDDREYEEALVNTVRELKRRLTLAEIDLQLFQLRKRRSSEPSSNNESKKDE